MVHVFDNNDTHQFDRTLDLFIINIPYHIYTDIFKQVEVSYVSSHSKSFQNKRIQKKNTFGKYIEISIEANKV